MHLSAFCKSPYLIAATLLVGVGIPSGFQAKQAHTLIAGMASQPDGGSNSESEYATLNIAFPLSYTVSPFSLFLNRKPVAHIANGKRVVFRAMSESPIAITTMTGIIYVEPGALAKNHRILTLFSQRLKPYA